MCVCVCVCEWMNGFVYSMCVCVCVHIIIIKFWSVHVQKFKRFCVCVFVCAIISRNMHVCECLSNYVCVCVCVLRAHARVCVFLYRMSNTFLCMVYLHNYIIVDEWLLPWLKTRSRPIQQDICPISKHIYSYECSVSCQCLSSLSWLHCYYANTTQLMITTCVRSF